MEIVGIFLFCGIINVRFNLFKMNIGELIIYSTALAGTFSALLGFFSLKLNPKSRVVQLWFLTTMAITVWTIGYLISVTSPTDERATIGLKIVYLGAVFVPILTFHFLSAFLYKNVTLKKIIIPGYFLAVVFLFFTTFTNLIISGVRYLENFGRYEEITIPGFILFLVYFFFYAGGSVILLVTHYKYYDKFRQRQIKYLIIASIIGFVGGTSNFITDLTGVYPYGQLIIWLYPVFVTYGIFIEKIQIKIS
jgi:hypothetical protein